MTVVVLSFLCVAPIVVDINIMNYGIAWHGTNDILSVICWKPLLCAFPITFDLVDVRSFRDNSGRNQWKKNKI